jgi:flagellin
MISVLNNVASMNAQNALSTTNASLQGVLQQLSTGLKINSGADDAAGLSIAAGLGANIAALTQSSQNASNGVGLLQIADGALSQVTSLLNRATTLATEAANGGLSTSQSTALDTEFQSILSEINQIGSTTNYNVNAVFSATAISTFTSDGTTGGTTTTSTTTGGALRDVSGVEY